MDTVTFAVTPALSSGMLLLLAVISALCYLLVYYIANKAFGKYKIIIYAITAGLGLGLSIIINFVVYTLLI